MGALSQSRRVRSDGERFVSDGEPTTVTVPASRREKLRADLPKTLKVVER